MRSRDVRPIVGPIDRLLASPRSPGSSASASGPLWRVFPRFRVKPLQTRLLQVARQRARTPKPKEREPEQQKALPGRPRPLPVEAYKRLFQSSRIPRAASTSKIRRQGQGSPRRRYRSLPAGQHLTLMRALGTADTTTPRSPGNATSHSKADAMPMIARPSFHTAWALNRTPYFSSSICIVPTTSTRVNILTSFAVEPTMVIAEEQEVSLFKTDHSRRL
jgi:hypothetical protein